ncbi:carotene 7,8-desaturase [Geobacillus sp. 46C-IIa]|uniref:hydroxysqualene dehydroxylase n=1 Tax=Geobacillus sp. 46C-IIa TaxID=1963025 RepID=UPI0009BD64A3|nr:FAD-dependent oxidoreductase [Geobacillus sp. 46C-IIa]OQP07145.1 carotene 7,8-desaturase [Geobacillus sp. 46C-IIa]QNU29470.1 FAD-dependent oxidoreductase [Geobacillus sp. 46C-IIa]
MNRYEVIVIGSGLAGLACAWELVRRRHRVLVLEREPVIGGRTSSWEENGMLVESGFHRMIGYYRALPRLLESVGVSPNDIFYWEREIDILKDRRTQGTFGIAPVYAPLRFLRGLAANNDLIGPMGKLSLLPFFIRGLYDSLVRPHELDRLSVLDYARQCGVSSEAVTWLVKPLTTGIFFLPIERFSAYVFFGLMRPAVPRFYRMQIGAFLGGMTEVMMKPIAEAIERHGGDVQTGVCVEQLLVEHGRVSGVIVRGEPIRAKETVVATSLGAAKRLLAPHFLSRPSFASLFALPTMPAVTVQLEMDQPSRPHDRTTFAPETVLSSFAEQSRTTFRHVPGRLSIIIGDPERWINASEEAILSQVYAGADTIGLPLGGHVRQSRVVSHPEDFHSLAPGYDHLRPGQQTDVPGLTLAGDYTRQPYFATMEGAVLSGQWAAAVVARRFGG